MTKTKPALRRKEFDIAIDDCSFYRSPFGPAHIDCDTLFDWVEQERIKAQIEALKEVIHHFTAGACAETCEDVVINKLEKLKND